MCWFWKLWLRVHSYSKDYKVFFFSLVDSYRGISEGFLWETFTHKPLLSVAFWDNSRPRSWKKPILHTEPHTAEPHTLYLPTMPQGILTGLPGWVSACWLGWRDGGLLTGSLDSFSIRRHFIPFVAGPSSGPFGRHRRFFWFRFGFRFGRSWRR